MTIRPDANPQPEALGQKIRRYLTHDSMTTVGFSAYGNAKPFEQSSFLRPSRVFVQSGAWGED